MLMLSVFNTLHHKSILNRCIIINAGHTRLQYTRIGINWWLRFRQGSTNCLGWSWTKNIYYGGGHLCLQLMTGLYNSKWYPGVLPMAEADCLPESHQSGSPQTHFLEEGSSASQPITTVSSMNLHVYGIQWLQVRTCTCTRTTNHTSGTVVYAYM